MDVIDPQCMSTVQLAAISVELSRIIVVLDYNYMGRIRVEVAVSLSLRPTLDLATVVGQS
jgi:hypothetical protein